MDEEKLRNTTIGELEIEADSLSIKNQTTYNRCLKNLSLIGMTMVAAFLFYDELELSWMLFLYAFLLLIGGMLLKDSKKNRYQENYINYRLLAEVLRVQVVLDSAGIEKNAADFFSLTMKDDMKWIREIVEKCNHSGVTLSVEQLRTNWLQDQYNYHVSAEARVKDKLRINNTVSLCVKAGLVLILVTACVLELLPSVDMAEKIGTITLKGCVLIGVGLLSTVSFFLSSYYGKQALERKSHDHINMARLYKDVLDKTENGLLTVDIIENTAREEILENGNWYSYMKENTLSLDF